jgi:hypothetical protein
MELKVNIDKSTHQIMCSINETTTIQDMIVALAQALQQTGKFYLTEKSDSDERIISPNEKPCDLYKYYSSIGMKADLILKKLDDTVDEVVVEDDNSKIIAEDIKKKSGEVKNLNSLAHADLYNIISVQQNRLSYQTQRLDDIYKELSVYENSSSNTPLSTDNLI